MNLNSKVNEIVGIGENFAEKLKKLEIETIEDLLLYLPRRWDDYSNVLPINRVRPEELISIHGKVWQIANKRSVRGKSFTEAIINDGTGSMKAVWFNQPYLINSIKEGDEIFLSGKVQWNNGKFSLVSPSYEKIEKDEDPSLTHTGRIVPTYPETEGITSKWLRAKIKPLMKYIYSLKDYLPEEVKTDEKLLDFPAAIRQMHFPEDQSVLKKAKERLNFDEMFLLQLAVLNSKKGLQREKAIAIPFNEELSKRFVQEVGFELTNAQRKAAWEILQDITKPSPMNRLLQGDVGSGKTVVAGLVMANVAASGAQSALLCPTEILAKQHFEKISKMVEPLGFEVALLTGSTPKAVRDETLARLYEGEIKIVVGTHAILDKNIVFWRLALAIVDEQHRFGVEQRNALKKESANSGTMPHFLSMTATPIPRTLTLTLFGDLDVSVLDELPKGRQKIITKFVPREAKLDTYKFIENELKNGRQAFVVCPLIGEEKTQEQGSQDILYLETESETQVDLLEVERKSVLTEHEKLKKVFKDFEVGYLHGRMPQNEKDRVMKEYLDNKISVLVSTSVIEVGIDVPNATIMLIEDAERFGMSQLHQFRGRVGRGGHQSYCFLFSNTRNDEVISRLQALAETTDGFKLSEIDLELRGPGDFIGARQHGIADIKMKNLTNTILINRCRKAAAKFLEKHELKDVPLLVEKTKKFDGVLHLE